MKRLIPITVLTAVLVVFVSCSKKSGSTTPANPLASLNGNWYVNTWGGVAGNLFVFRINQETKTGAVQTVGSNPFGYAVGETLFSNITSTADPAVFTCTAIFKYGAGNTQTATTTGKLTLLAGNTQLLVQLAPAMGVTPADWTYLKQ